MLIISKEGYSDEFGSFDLSKDESMEIVELLLSIRTEKLCDTIGKLVNFVDGVISSFPKGHKLTEDQTVNLENILISIDNLGLIKGYTND